MADEVNQGDGCFACSGRRLSHAQCDRLAMWDVELDPRYTSRYTITLPMVRFQ